MISSLCLSMIFAQTRFAFVAREKPVSAFPDHALVRQYQFEPEPCAMAPRFAFHEAGRLWQSETQRRPILSRSGGGWSALPIRPRNINAASTAPTPSGAAARLEWAQVAKCYAPGSRWHRHLLPGPSHTGPSADLRSAPTLTFRETPVATLPLAVAKLSFQSFRRIALRLPPWSK
jgi:hypothetical protein